MEFNNNKSGVIKSSTSVCVVFFACALAAIILLPLPPHSISAKYITGIYIVSLAADSLFCYAYFWRRITNYRASRGLRLADSLCALNALYVISYYSRGSMDPYCWWPFFVFSVFWYAFFTIKRSDILHVFHVAFAAVGVECAIAVGNYIVGTHQFHTPGFGSRTSGTYESPNTLYPLCLLDVPLGAGLLFCATNRIVRYYLIFLLGISLVALVCTFSRAGWIAAAFELVYLTSFGTLVTNHIRVVRIFGSALGIVLVVAAVYTRTGGALMGSSTDRSSMGRLAIWNVALHVIISRPLFGYGLGNYGLEQRAFEDRGLAFYDPNNSEPKSLYLSVLVDFGVVGLLVFGLVVYAYRAQLGAPRLEFRFQGLRLAITTGLVGVLLAGIVDTPVMDVTRIQPTVIFLLFLAVLGSITEEHSSGVRVAGRQYLTTNVYD